MRKETLIAWVVPRYHTNQIAWIEELMKHGVKVNMIVERLGFTEDYSIIKPNLRYHGSGNHLRKLLITVSYYRRILGQVDSVLVRDINRYSNISIFLYAYIFTNRRIFIYSQTPCYQRNTLQRILFYSILFLRFNTFWITPVLGDPTKFNKRHFRFLFVPFLSNAIQKPRRTNADLIERVNFLCVSKFVKRKNLHYLLELALKLKEVRNISISIVGEVSTSDQEIHYKEFSQDVIAKGLENVISCYVNVKHSEIHRFYDDADIFVLCSRDEPASYSVIEARARNIPVICSDTNGTKDYIDSEYIFETGDISSFIWKCQNLLKRSNYEDYVFPDIEHCSDFNQFVDLCK